MESVRPGWCSPWAELSTTILVAIGDLAGVLEDLVGENHEVLAGLVMVILVDQEGLGAPRQGQPVEGVLIVGDAVDRGGRTFTGHAVHGGTGLGCRRRWPWR